MTDTPLKVIANPTAEERLNAFPMPTEGPYYIWSESEKPTTDGNIVCGRCLRVVAKGMTMLTLWETSVAPKGLRMIIRCSCGAHLLIPSQEGEWLTLEELKRGGRSGKRKSKRPPPENII